MPEEKKSITSAIERFDGKDPAPLRELASEMTERYVPHLIDLADGEPKEQQAATWILKDWTDRGHTLDGQSASMLIRRASRFEHWEATLHVLQMLGAGMAVPAHHVDEAINILQANTVSERPFLRAWAYYGLAAVARQHPQHRELVAGVLDAAADDPAGSVRARLKRARQLLEKS